MSFENGLTPGEQELEAALGELKPSTVHADRDRLMFDAGLSQGRRRQRMWQGMSSVLVLLLAVSLWYQPPTTDSMDQPGLDYANQDVIDSSLQFTAMENVPTSTAPVNRPPKNSYWSMRNQLLEKGMEALPETIPSQAGDEPPLSRRELLEIL